MHLDGNVDSSGVGGAGNVLISGHQVSGEALLAPLTTGEIEVGQEIHVTDSEGIVFVYRVTEISDPIAISGADEDEIAEATRFITAGERPLLTLITGWPDFTTTHRIFAQAELLGLKQ